MLDDFFLLFGSHRWDRVMILDVVKGGARRGSHRETVADLRYSDGVPALYVLASFGW